MSVEYKEGQVWKYQTRPGEEESRILILKTEYYLFPERVDVVHIAINNLKLKNAKEKSGISEEINFLPFSKRAIDKSVVELEEENVWIHPYEDGYVEWKKSFVVAKGGVFDMTIRTALKSVEQSLEK